MCMRSGQLRYRPFSSAPERRGERQLGAGTSVLGGPRLSASQTDHRPQGARTRSVKTYLQQRRICPQSVYASSGTDKSAVAEQSQMGEVEVALPPSASPSDMLLRRIAILLFILVAGLLTVFGYYASSICITVVLAGFLAILFDPVVVTLEKLHLPRGVAAAAIVLAGMSLIGLLGYALYGRAMSFSEELPVYASKVQQP